MFFLYYKEKTFIMSIWKRIIIILSFCIIYYTIYRILGFELTVIAGIVNIISDSVIKDMIKNFPKKVISTKNSEKVTRWKN